MLPLDHSRGILDLDKFALLVIQEVERKVVREGVVGKEHTF